MELNELKKGNEKQSSSKLIGIAGHLPKPISQELWIMLMVNTGRKILQYNEDRLPLLITILQEIIEKIGNQELRCKILNCLLSAKLNIVLKGLDGIFQIDGKTNKEVQCLLDELFKYDETFMAKLSISEQNATKQHVSDMKKLILKDHIKVRKIYSEEGAKRACVAEFDDMIRGVAEEMNRSFLTLIAEKLSGNHEAEGYDRAASTATISSPTLDTNSRGKRVESRLHDSQEVGPAVHDALSRRRPTSSNSSYLLRKNKSEKKKTVPPSRNFPQTRSRKNLDESCRKKADCFIKKTEKLKITEERIELLYELLERGKKLDKSKTRRVIRRRKALGDRNKKLENSRRRKNSSGFVRSACNSIGNCGVTASEFKISGETECESEKCTMGNRTLDGKSGNACEIADDRDDKTLAFDGLSFAHSALGSSAAFDRYQYPVKGKEHTGALVDMEAATECTQRHSCNGPFSSCAEEEQACIRHFSSLGLTVDTKRRECNRVTRTLDEPSGKNYRRHSKKDDTDYLFCNRSKRSYASMELFEEDTGRPPIHCHKCESTGRNEDEGIVTFKRNGDTIGGIHLVNECMGDDTSCRSVKLQHDHLGQRHHIVDSDVDFSVNKADLEITIYNQCNDTETSTDPLEASASCQVVSSIPRKPVRCRPQQVGDMDKSQGNGFGNAARSSLSSIERAKRTTIMGATRNREAIWKEEQCSCVRRESELHSGCQHESGRMLSDLASNLLVLHGLLTDIKCSTAFDTSSEDSPSPVEETVCKNLQEQSSSSVTPGRSFLDRVERSSSASLDKTKCYPTQRQDNSLQCDGLNTRAENFENEGELEMQANCMALEEASEPYEPYDITGRIKSTDCMQNDYLHSEVGNESGQRNKGIINEIKSDDASKRTALRDIFTNSGIASQNRRSVVDFLNEKREEAGKKEEKRVSVAESKRDEAKKKVLDFIDLCDSESTHCDSSDGNCFEDGCDARNPLRQSLSQMDDINEDLSVFNTSPMVKKPDVSKWGHYVFSFDDISPEKEDRYDKFAKDRSSRSPACINISSNCSFSLQLDKSPSPSFQP